MNSIQALCQTRDGYLWFTTGNGIVRFDGVRFKVFSSNDTPGLISDHYTYYALHEDREGTLWAGTLSNGVLLHQNGMFRSLTTDDGLPDNHVLRIDEDEHGLVWIFTARGLARWTGGHLLPVRQTDPPLSDVADAGTPTVTGDAVYTGLWRRNAQGWWRFAYGHWSRMPLPAALANSKMFPLRSICEDSNRRLWFNLLNRRESYYCVENGRLSIYNGLPVESFVSFRDREGYLWLTDHQAHTARWKNGKLERINGFSTPSFFRVLEDRDGDLWVGTVNAGLLRRRPLLFLSMRHHAPAEMSATLLRDRNGDIWVGSLGLKRYRNADDPVFQRFHTPAWHRNTPWDRNTITALYEDRDGTFIVGFRDGLSKFRNGKFVRDDLLASGIGKAVNTIYRDHSGDLWIGCDGGLFVLRHGRPARYEMKTNPTNPNPSISSILEDRAGRLWIGTDAGLCFRDGSGFHEYRDRIGKELGNIDSLYEDRDGVLWIATDGQGLWRIADGKCAQYTSARGLASNTLFHILDDDRGFLWITSQHGILRLDKRELTAFAAGRVTHIASTRFGRADGLADEDCQSLGQPGAVKALDGKLWFADGRGTIAVADPKKLPSDTNAPVVLIEDCTVDGRSKPCDTELAISPREALIAIQYTALGFNKPDQFTFKYRLAGLDEDWTYAGTRRTAYFSHLPAGDYTFQIAAANSSGVWNPEAKTLRIIVQQVFYATWWFRALLLLSAAGILSWTWWYRMAQIRRAQAAQQAFSQQLITSQERERQRIAAELHDSLGQRLVVINNLALFSLNAANEENKNHERIQEIQLQASSASKEVKEIAYNLRPYQLDRIGLTKAVDSLTRGVGRASRTEISAIIDNIDDAFPKELQINFYRIVQEALNNVVKHAEASHADVIVRRTPGLLILVIKDDGKGGISGAADPDDSASGFGLTGMKERGQLLGGKMTIRSVSGQGTEIKLEVATSLNRSPAGSSADLGSVVEGESQ